MLIPVRQTATYIAIISRTITKANSAFSTEDFDHHAPIMAIVENEWYVRTVEQFEVVWKDLNRSGRYYSINLSDDRGAYY